MTIWLYCICRNEIQILPYFLRHYVPWVDKLIFYDDQSDDGTRQLIQATPKTELRNWPGSSGLDDAAFLDFANEQWKEARGKAEWVIWVDSDELLYHENMIPLLADYLATGVELPQIRGYTMFSREFPTTTGQIYEQVRAGVPDDVWNKPSIFRGNMHWTMGRHGMDWTKVSLKSSPTVEIKLLHYRGLGMEYVRWRHARNWARVPDHCRRMHLGENTNPEWTSHHGLEWFREVMSRNLPWVV
jgi:glycosyltransferase involved in cell wall biosynthesis